jgi:hypothetical protein
MDKHVHRDIGEQFRDEINSMSRAPREHIWQHIDNELDKSDAGNYKERFTRLRKRTMLLLILLVGFATFSVLYFTASKRKAAIENFYDEAKAGNHKNKQEMHEQTNVPDAPAVQNNTIANPQAANLLKSNTTTRLFSPAKLPIKKNGKTAVTINNGSMSETGTEEDKNSLPLAPNEVVGEKPLLPTAVKANITNGMIEKIPQLVITEVKKEAPQVTPDNQPAKSNAIAHSDKKSRFTITVFGAPDYSAYSLKNDQLSNYDNKAGIEKREQSDLSLTAGMLLGYQFTKKISLQSGITYSASDISISPTRVYAEKDNTGLIKYRYNTSSGYVYLLPSFSTSPAVGDSLYADGANHTLHYISIPLIVQYKLGSKKLSFNPGLGLTFNFLTKATLTADLSNRFNRETESTTKLESIKKSGASLLFIPELQYELSKKWSISALPYFKYSLGAINRGNVVQTRPYTFGLGIGMVYRF